MPFFNNRAITPQLPKSNINFCNSCSQLMESHKSTGETLLFPFHNRACIYIYTKISITRWCPSSSIDLGRNAISKSKTDRAALFEPSKYKEQTMPPLSIDLLRAPFQLNRIGHEEIFLVCPSLIMPRKDKHCPPPFPLDS